MAERLFCLVYVSSAVRPFSRNELLDLLEQSRANNANLGITGMLLYKDGNFMQAVEGPEEAVRNLKRKIFADHRHHGLITMLQEYRDEREFGEWSMGFKDLSASASVHMNPSFSEFLNTPLTGSEFADDPQRCQRLLLCFKRST